MIEFSENLEQRILEIADQAVGLGSDTVNYVKTLDDYLHDVDLDAMPLLVVTARTVETTGAGEMGTLSNLWNWVVHLYYLDTTVDYHIGKTRRSNILSRLERALEKDKRLGNLEVTDPILGREYVWDTTITAVLFDYTGQDEYHSFVSELYLNVATAKS